MQDMTLELKPSPLSPPTPAITPVLPMKRPPKKRRTWIWWAIGGVLVLLVLIGWGVHHHFAAMADAMTPVEIATVTRTDVEKSVESAGKVMSAQDVDIKCRASGPVKELPVDISQKVKTGDLLCKLDPADEELAVRVAEQTVAQSTAKLEQAKLAYDQAKLNLETTRDKVEASLASAKVKADNLQSKADRQKQLKDQKLGSEEDFETAQTDAAVARADAEAAQVAVNELKQQDLQLQAKKFDVATAEAQLLSDNINLDTQRHQLEYCTVLSPIDGTVSSITANLNVGSMIQSGTGGFSGGTTIMTLSDLSHMYVMATVDQSDYGGIELGQPARVQVDSFPNRSFVGKVVRKATTGVNTSNVVTFEVKVEVTDKDKNLLQPQMTGTVTIIENQRKNVLVLPTAAVEHRAGQTYVQLVGGKEQAVVLGLDGGESVEVVSGLKEGDKVTLKALELPTRWKASDGGPPR